MLGSLCPLTILMGLLCTSNRSQTSFHISGGKAVRKVERLYDGVASEDMSAEEKQTLQPSILLDDVSISRAFDEMMDQTQVQSVQFEGASTFTRLVRNQARRSGVAAACLTYSLAGPA